MNLDQATAMGFLISVLVLAAGCIFQVLLGDAQIPWLARVFLITLLLVGVDRIFEKTFDRVLPRDRRS